MQSDYRIVQARRDDPAAPEPDPPGKIPPTTPEPPPVPWHNPGPPVRKIDLPPNTPSPGVPINPPEQ